MEAWQRIIATIFCIFLIVGCAGKTKIIHVPFKEPCMGALPEIPEYEFPPYSKDLGYYKITPEIAVKIWLTMAILKTYIEESIIECGIKDDARGSYLPAKPADEAQPEIRPYARNTIKPAL